MWYENVDRSFFRSVTIHAFDRRTDGLLIACSAVKIVKLPLIYSLLFIVPVLTASNRIL